MLSDEMTTGSMTTSDADKRALAVRSHSWNIEQRRFKEAFPEVCSSSHSAPSPRFALSIIVTIMSFTPEASLTTYLID